MSEENTSGSATTQPEGSQEEKVEYVPVKAYEEVTKDMHRFKKEREDRAAEVNALRAQLKEQEEAKMRENEQWQEIAKLREAELEEERTKYQTETSSFQKALKRTALKQELGGTIKEDYLQFANLDAIQMNEGGMVDSESLRNVANEFRKQHGQLIPQAQEKEITGHASNVQQVSTPTDPGKMSTQELIKHYEQLKKIN